ncbi:MAG TPA: polysaccharide deacetylase family protein [Polyangiaceae bacterium]|nr:polysaccharide deacetylase family protein [Polyangiaceae bacterium]
MTSIARFSFLASTAGLGGLAAGALLPTGPSLGLLSSAVLGWGALLTTGVFFPGLQMYGPVLCRGPAGARRVALTFDDGPNQQTTPRVLAALRGTRHRATFFVLGNKVRERPDVARQIRDEGHALALHGDSHDRLHSFRSAARVRDELRRAQDAVESATGLRPQLFRPPVGHTTPATLRGARAAGVTVIGWSARGYDGLRGRRSEAVVAQICRSLDDGAIVLLHDSAERDDFEPAGLRALPVLLAELDARGLTSVALEPWLAEK